MAKPVVTPVEERIDHDHEVRRIAGQVGELLDFARGNPVVLSKLHEIIDALERLARIDLLTEHSAREAYAAGWYAAGGPLDQHAEAYERWLALPATESAQPEEERRG